MKIEENNKRRFKCYNINFHVGNEDASELIQNCLNYSEKDFDNTLIISVISAQIKYLTRTFWEVIIELDNIDDDDIEDQLSDKISEATGWLHEGYDYEELN